VVAADRYRAKLLAFDTREDSGTDTDSDADSEVHAAAGMGAVHDAAPTGTHSFDPEDSS
jgi:hypothetical protein